MILVPLAVNFRVETPIPVQSMSASKSSPSSAQVAPNEEVGEIKLLTSTNDDHGGVIVEMDESMDSTTFVSILRASISHWKKLVVYHIS